MRVLLDANVLLRALLPSRNPSRAVSVILTAAVSGQFTALLPPELIAEVLANAATKPYLAQRIGHERAAALIGTLSVKGEEVAPLKGPFPARSRNPEDDYLFAYAEAAQADYLVSDDADVLTVDIRARSFALMTVAEFLAELRARGLIEPPNQ